METTVRDIERLLGNIEHELSKLIDENKSHYQLSRNLNQATDAVFSARKALKWILSNAARDHRIKANAPDAGGNSCQP